MLAMESEELILLKQSSLCEDTVIKNGEEKNIHIVVKNSPFCLTFGLPSAFQTQPMGGYNMNDAQSEIRLVYDEDAYKEVDFLKSKPVQFKSSVNQQGSKITIEARIKVLTSQLEDSLFKVSVTLYDANTKCMRYQAFSEPIKVISKSDQVKHKRTPRAKRNVTDILSDSLAQLESKHIEQTQLLESFSQYHRAFLDQLQDSSSEHPPSKRLCTRDKEEHQSKEQDFQSALNGLLEVFASMNPEEKKEKISKLNVNSTVDNSGCVVGDIVFELLDLFWAEGLSTDILHELDEMSSNLQNTPRNTPTTTNTNSLPSQPMFAQPFAPIPFNNSSSKKTCRCHNCPYKKELGRIEVFYEEIFSTM